MEFETLSKLMRDNGIVGCGGAGFPSYAKLNKNVDTLIINCAECEPLLRLHRQLMERKTRQILEAITVLADTLNVDNVRVALKSVYVNTIAALKAVLDEFPKIQLALLDEVYPAGDEIVLIYNVTGRVVGPGKLPITQGVIVYNVETMYNLYRALQGKPVTHKYVTITGEVKEPRTFYAPIGSLIYGLVKRCGGVTVDNPAYLIGGPMMGRLGSDHDLVSKTTNAIIVLPKDHPVVLRKQVRPEIDVRRAMAACSQCHYCTDMCPRHMLGHPIDPAEVMRVVSNGDTHTVKPYCDAAFCSQCGVCEAYACHQGLSPRAVIAEIKKEMRANGFKVPEINSQPVPIPNQELRRTPLTRLRTRLKLDKYNHPSPIYLEPINAKEVDILLSQHIGVPASAIVKVGDKVKENDLIACAAEGKLSVNIHASIDGEVVEVTDKLIRIRS